MCTDMYGQSSQQHWQIFVQKWTRPFLGTEKPRIFSACSNVVAKWQKHSEMNFTNYINRNANNNILINYSIVL